VPGEWSFFMAIQPANGTFRQIFGWPNIFLAELFSGRFLAVCETETREVT